MKTEYFKDDPKNPLLWTWVAIAAGAVSTATIYIVTLSQYISELLRTSNILWSAISTGMMAIPAVLFALFLVAFFKYSMAAYDVSFSKESRRNFAELRKGFSSSLLLLGIFWILQVALIIIMTLLKLARGY